MINIRADINDKFNNADVTCNVSGSVDQILIEFTTLFRAMLEQHPEIFHAVLMQFDLVESFDKCNKDTISEIDLRISKMEGLR